MQSLSILAASASLLALTVPGSTAAAARSGSDGRGGLEPGKFVTYQQDVPVNVVLVGYDRKEVVPGLRSVLRQVLVAAGALSRSSTGCRAATSA